MVKTEGIFLDLENLKILSCVVRNLWVVQRFLNFEAHFALRWNDFPSSNVSSKSRSGEVKNGKKGKKFFHKFVIFGLLKKIIYSRKVAP